MARDREDSGRIDLDALMRQAGLTPEDGVPAVTEKAAPASRSPSRPPAPAPAPTPKATAAPSRPPPRVSVPPSPVPLRETPRDRPPPPASSRSRAWPLAALLAFGALGVIAYVRLPRATIPTAAARSEPPPTVTVAHASSPARPAEPSPTPTEPSLPATALDALPSASSARAVVPPPRAVPAAPPPAAPAATLAVNDAPSSAPAAPGDLAGAIRDSVGPTAAPKSTDDPAPSAAKARQLKPSPGAVVGAVNAVLPVARACLAREDPSRSATLVFASSGSVERVDLDGAPSDDDTCIRTALRKARVEPFVDDRFAFRVLVRP